MNAKYKQYIGISRDHSGSMQSITKAAMNDYNQNISAIKEAALANQIDTIVSVVKCGIGPGRGRVERDIVNSNSNALSPLTQYEANGGSTPLFDSVDELIRLLSQVPDANDPDVSFLIQVITDGQDNASTINGRTLGDKIRELQASDRWTFVFRVPRGYARALENLGIPSGNILEWDQTNAGMATATAATTQAFSSYYAARTRGIKSTTTFYSDLSQVTSAEVKAALKDISSDVKIWPVTIDDDLVSDFCYKMLGKPMVKGCAFYELNKTENAVQDYKKIMIQDMKSGHVYEGRAARQMLNLPSYGTVKLSPGDHSHYKIFIQSTSMNRKLKKGTSLLYWSEAV
jgi:hypothetical protein